MNELKALVKLAAYLVRKCYKLIKKTRFLDKESSYLLCSSDLKSTKEGDGDEAGEKIGRRAEKQAEKVTEKLIAKLIVKLEVGWENKQDVVLLKNGLRFDF